MSETHQPEVALTGQPLVAGPALISSSPANQATAAASGGAAGAGIVILIWLLGAVHVTVPGEVAASMAVLVTAGVHWASIRWGLSDTTIGEPK